MGNILGFKYSKKSGKLEYFRYLGIGRYLLLNFLQLFAADGRDGLHTVLIFGTSYGTGNPAYHISTKPTVLLKPEKTMDGGIQDSDFRFTPQMNSQHNYITVLGLPYDKRKIANDEMIAAICNNSGRVPSFLDGIFKKIQEKEKEKG